MQTKLSFATILTGNNNEGGKGRDIILERHYAPLKMKTLKHNNPLNLNYATDYTHKEPSELLVIFSHTATDQ